MLFYDDEEGTNRESWTVFCTPYEIFLTKEEQEVRKKEIKLLRPHFAFEEHTVVVGKREVINV